MSGRRSFPLMALLIGLAAAGGGALCRLSRPPQPARAPRITVAFINGFSWEKVIPLWREGRIAFFDELYPEKGSFGDIMSENFPSDLSVEISLLTGRWPQRHRVESAADLSAPDKRSRRARTPVWNDLAMHGQGCAVIGFPPLPGGDNPRIITASGQAEKGETETSLSQVANGTPLSPALGEFLRDCLASDLGNLTTALRFVGDSRYPHLFVSFGGLGRWQRRLLSRADGLPENAAGRLLDDYYVVLFRAMTRLLSVRRKDGVLFVVSDRGNLQGRPTYRVDFPPMKNYPPMGFMYAAGESIREGILPLVVNPVDLAPTLLYLAGKPVPNNMDGRIMVGVLDEDYYFKHLPTFR